MAHVLNYLPSSKTVLAAASVASFIGYAIYVDKRRRSAPDYKQKIRENRKLKQARLVENTTVFPNPRNRQAMEQFLFSELTLGEELLHNGDVDQGVYHMANAVMCSDRPEQFLSIFQQTLSMEFFQKLVSALPEAKKRLSASLEKFYGNVISQGVKITPVDDDDSGPAGSQIMIDQQSGGEVKRDGSRNVWFNDDSDLE